MKKVTKALTTGLTIFAAGTIMSGPMVNPASAADVNLTQAVNVATAAVARATAIGVPMNVAIVDTGGRLKVFAREDGAWKGSIDIAQAKAFTAVAFCNDNGPVCVNTAQLKPLVQPGQDLFGLISTNRKDGIVAFDGGVTLCSGGSPIGAIGVSGGSIAQDQDVARTAAASSGFLCAGQ